MLSVILGGVGIIDGAGRGGEGGYIIYWGDSGNGINRGGGN